MFTVSQQDFYRILDQIDETCGAYLRKLSQRLSPVLDFVRRPSSEETVTPLEQIDWGRLLQLGRDHELPDAI